MPHGNLRLKSGISRINEIFDENPTTFTKASQHNTRPIALWPAPWYMEPMTPLKGILAIFFILLCIPAALLAHQYPDFDQSTSLTIDPDRFILEYRIWYGPVLIPGLALDSNTDGRLAEDELYAHLQQTDHRIREGLSLSLNGTALEARPLTATISSSGTYPRISLDIALWYTAEAAPPPGPGQRLTLRDTNFAAYGSKRKLFFINAASRAGDIRIHRDGPETQVTYTQGGGFGMAPKEAGQSARSPAPSRPHPARSQDSRLTRFLQRGSLGPAMIVTAFATAFILGAAHALSPGHGKAMVAAYLVGTRGRKRDAVILGLFVTLTHVISVIVLGLIALYLSTRILPDQLFPWISVASGILIFVTGFLLLARDRSGLHLHSHEHSHAPNHSKARPEPGPGILSLLAMGIAGGMVPCPSAMVVLLVSVSLHKIALGLSLIIVFSLGLATVLVGIGIAVVSVSGLSSAVDRFFPIVRVLPLLGAGLVLLLGIAITARGLAEAGIIQISGL